MNEIEDETIQIALSSFESTIFSLEILPSFKKWSVNEARNNIKKMAQKMKLELGEYMYQSSPEPVKTQYAQAILEIERVLKQDGLFFLQIGYPKCEFQMDLFITDFQVLYPYLVALDIVKKTNLILRKDFLSKISYKLVPILPHTGNVDDVSLFENDIVEHWFMFSKGLKWKDNKSVKLPTILEGTSKIIQWRGRFMAPTSPNIPPSLKIDVNVEVKASPEEILRLLIEKFSDEGDWVLDSFAGSGTLALVAAPLGRNSVLYERHLSRFQLLMERLNRANLPFEENRYI